MTIKIRRLILTGLSLVLIGGVLSPTVVRAATTDSVATTSDPSNTDTAVTFDEIQLPYILITDSHGTTTKVPWYSEFKTQVNSREKILKSDENGNIFANELIKDEPTHPEASNDASTLINLAESGVTLNSGDKYADYLLSQGMYPGAKSSADITTAYETLAYAYTWLFASVARAHLHQTNYTTIDKDYTSNVLPTLLTEENIIGSNQVGMFKSIMSDENTFNGEISPLLRETVEFHLESLTVDQLAQLDPTASKDAETKLLQTPMTDLVTKQADGSLLADGLLTDSALPNAYVLKRAADQPATTATSQPVTVHYVDDQGNTLKPDKTLTGSLGDDYKTEPLSIDGYQLLNTTGDESGKFTSSDQAVTYTYHKVAADVVVKDSVVYATKKIGLYGSPTFTKKALKTTYAKKARMNRPMFKVIGTATSQNGVKRYKVTDLNGKGATGYITANAKFVAPLYYTKNRTEVTVINPGGLNAYTKKSLTGKKTHYKQGQVLKVKKIVSHNLTTRFVLNNGKYISTNKKLVTAGKYTMPKRVQAKTAINRYGTANLTKKNQHFAKMTTFTVTGWAYSNANNFHKGDTLRYKVAGGYITANANLVKELK
ncbi:DUF5776 domain-containing protein [Levilactobacillus fuyuanensis]|uniref:DUF5776 domain-containing protein n=1 Tax=Levilactobacillus fuyuanensis TaxID=2486022 RepID=A0ABW4GZK9_9LACO|nr:DUF5776 domain-containing protein [Levilactobacillus fuyuanensis]